MPSSFFHPKDGHAGNWKGYSLLLPAISVGNVGQLAVDVIISSTRAERVGSIYHQSLLPVVGNNPYSADNSTCQLSSSCDVYCKPELKLLIIQQRATFVKGRRQQFRQSLIQWFKDSQLDRMIIVGSIFSHLRTDRQLVGTQFRYLATASAREAIASLKGFVELEDTPDAFGRMEKQMPGSGVTKTLLHDCDEMGVPALALLMYCAEGDNASDALRMVNHLNHLLKIKPVKDDCTVDELQSTWTIPASWSLNFGNRFQHTIY